MAPATPSLPLAPVPVGHLTVLSEPTCLCHWGDCSSRNDVNSFVVPDSSERWTTVIALSGSLAPGFSFESAGSFQFLILPRNRSAIVGPSSLSPLGAPLTLYETVMAPNTVGTCTGSPFF